MTSFLKRKPHQPHAARRSLFARHAEPRKGLPKVSLLFPVALLLNLLIELLNHKGFAGLGRFLLESPLAFFVNFLIILFTLTPCLLFRRQVFCLTVLSLIWLSTPYIFRL